MTLEEILASVPKELTERCCGCGSMHDAYEVAHRLAKAEDDCSVWQLTVLEMAKLLIQRRNFRTAKEATEATEIIEAKALVYFLHNPGKLDADAS